MPAEEFGGSVWLPYAILGVLLCIGYLFWRLLGGGASGSAEQGPRPRSQLERELQAEIDAVRDRSRPSDGGAEGTADSEGAPEKTDAALDLPAEERRKQEEIRRHLGPPPGE